MTKEIRTVTVIGAAGAMGAGIAAHLANAGIKVHALDIVPGEKHPLYVKMKKTGDRNIVVRDKIEKMKKIINPMEDILNAGFMHPSNADRIVVGNTEDDLERAILDSDWLIEAIPDKPEWKQGLFAKIEKIGKEDLFVSSNTSTMPIEILTKGRSDDFKKNFMITHFFNPPRFMRLLETIAGPKTSPDMVKTISEFADKSLGKYVMPCKDTPFFVGNRIGMPFVMIAATRAIEQGITIDEVDEMLGKPFGMGEGVFRMVDTVGLGLVPDLARNADSMLPKDDDFHDLNYHPVMNLVENLIKRGYKGRADGGGFYRPKRDENGKSVKGKDGKTILQCVDLVTGEYRDPSGKKLAAAAEGKKGPWDVLEFGDKYSDYAWSVVRDIILYALDRVPEIADSIEDIDAGMRHGYNWKQGPFELLDKIGVEYFVERITKKDNLFLPPLLEMAKGRDFYKIAENGEKMRLDFNFHTGEASYVPVKHQEGVLNLDDIKRSSKPVITHRSASTWNIGDGVLCLEFHSKMNTMDPSILYVMNETIKTMTENGDKYKALVLYNDAGDFSVGANIGLIDGFVSTAKKAEKYSKAASEKLWEATYQFVDNFAYAGQPVYKALREAPFPVVGAPSGRGWGGGCEALLHCDALQANAEMSMALVEAGVGLIPGWGGTLRLLERMQARLEYSDKGPFVPLKNTFGMIADPLKSGSTSAQDAFHKGWLRYGVDDITMNRDRLLFDAKAKALSMIDGYKPPEPAKLRLPGGQAKAAFKSAVDSFYIAGPPTTWYDVVVADALGDTLSGGDSTHIGKIVTEEEYLRRESANFNSLTRLQPTMNRIHHMIVKGKPLREGPLEKPVSIDDIRAMRKPVAMPERPLDGKPLDGEEGRRLKRLADLTAAMLDLNEGKQSRAVKNLLRAALG